MNICLKNNYDEIYIDTYFNHFFTESFYEEIEKDILFELNILKTSLTYIFTELTKLETTTEKGEFCKTTWIEDLKVFKDLVNYQDYYQYLYQSYQKPKLTGRGFDESEKDKLVELRDSFQKIIEEMKKIVIDQKEVYEKHIELTKPHIAFLLEGHKEI